MRYLALLLFSCAAVLPAQAQEVAVEDGDCSARFDEACELPNFTQYRGFEGEIAPDHNDVDIIRVSCNGGKVVSIANFSLLNPINGEMWLVTLDGEVYEVSTKAPGAWSQPRLHLYCPPEGLEGYLVYGNEDLSLNSDSGEVTSSATGGTDPDPYFHRFDTFHADRSLEVEMENGSCMADAVDWNDLDYAHTRPDLDDGLRTMMGSLDLTAEKLNHFGINVDAQHRPNVYVFNEQGEMVAGTDVVQWDEDDPVSNDWGPTFPMGFLAGEPGGEYRIGIGTYYTRVEGDCVLSSTEFNPFYGLGSIHVRLIHPTAEVQQLVATQRDAAVEISFALTAEQNSAVRTFGVADGDTLTVDTTSVPWISQAEPVTVMLADLPEGPVELCVQPLSRGTYWEDLPVFDPTCVMFNVTSAAEDRAVVDGTALRAPYPNPARGGVTLPFALGRSGEVTLAVYDVLGRQVAVLADGPRAAGEYEVSLDAAPLAPGLCSVRLTAAGNALTQRLTVLR